MARTVGGSRLLATLGSALPSPYKHFTMSEAFVWDDAQARALFDRMIERGDDLTPLMADIREHLIESTKDRFDQGVAPDGTPWEPVKRGGTPLLATGTLRDEIAGDSGEDYAEVFSDRKQAAWLHFGTDGPYRILPTNGKALNIPGIGPRASVMHPGLVARPFLGVSAEDAAVIQNLASLHLGGE